MKTFTIFFCFILFVQCHLILVAAFDWFPSAAKNDNVDYLDEDLAEARLFFNTTGTYNATSLALVSDATLFVALNTIFVMTFVYT